MKLTCPTLAIAFNLSLGIVTLATAIAPLPSLALPTIANSQQFGVAPPACEAETQLALNACASRWAKTAEFLRSLVYKEVAQQLPAARQNQLAAIEKTWTAYRETHCRELSAPFRQGSIYPLLYFSCRANVTNDRIADLQGSNSSKLSSDVTAQRLTQALNQGNLKNSAGQKQWLQYQAQHCQFESLRSTEPSKSMKQCRDRLAEGRLYQLEALTKSR